MLKKSLVLGMAVAFSAGGLLSANVAQGANFGDMMNPSKWFGGGRDRDYYYDRDYYDRHYYDRYYGGPGYGWRAPGYGWGAPGYGYYGAPGYGWGAPGYGAPAQQQQQAPAAEKPQ